MQGLLVRGPLGVGVADVGAATRGAVLGAGGLLGLDLVEPVGEQRVVALRDGLGEAGLAGAGVDAHLLGAEEQEAAVGAVLLHLADALVALRGLGLEGALGDRLLGGLSLELDSLLALGDPGLVALHAVGALAELLGVLGADAHEVEEAHVVQADRRGELEQLERRVERGLVDAVEPHDDLRPVGVADVGDDPELAGAADVAGAELEGAVRRHGRAVPFCGGEKPP